MAAIHPDSQRLSDRFHTRGKPKVIICICFLLQSLGLPCRASAQVCVTDPMFYLRVRGGMLLGASRRVQYAALIKEAGSPPCITHADISVSQLVLCRVEIGSNFQYRDSLTKHAQDNNYCTASIGNFLCHGTPEKFLNYHIAGIQYWRLPAAKEHTREVNYGKEKTEESLIQLCRVTTSPVPQWKPGRITGGGPVVSCMAVHQDPKIAHSFYFFLIVLGSVCKRLSALSGDIISLTVTQLPDFSASWMRALKPKQS